MSEPDPNEEVRLISLMRTGDLTSRAVYADWLEDRGQLLRASVLRDPRPPGDVVADLVQWVSEISGDCYYQMAPGRSFLWLGTPQDILPGQQAQICSRPRSSFRPTQIVVPDEIAGHFALVDLRIGNRSQFEHPGEIACSFLTISAIRAHQGLFRFETVQVAMDLTVVVQNTSPEPRRFGALVFGKTPADPVNEAADDDQPRLLIEHAALQQRRLLGAWYNITGAAAGGNW